MSNFIKIADDIKYEELLEQIESHPELWNQYSVRKTTPGTPHAAMSDIWVRFRDPGELKEPKNYAEPHFPVWYLARRSIPAVEPIALEIMAKVKAVQLGGILITKIPPSGRIEPHDDRGGWHAEYYNCKVYIPLKSNTDCINICENDRISMMPGEAWTFDNLKVHSVENNGREDRITLIICMRVEP